MTFRINPTEMMSGRAAFQMPEIPRVPRYVANILFILLRKMEHKNVNELTRLGFC